jgi:tetratricopeptide (TPR) repeat protein
LTVGTDQFSDLLRNAVSGYAARTGAKKRVIAERCGYSPGMLSHLLSGKRRPGSREAVLALGRTLELSRIEANRLLAALDYSPLTRAELGAVVLERRIAQVSVEELPQPDRDLLNATMNNDLRMLSAAWRQYVDVREEARHRNWAQTTARVEEARALYRELQTIAPRFAAWLELSEAQSQRYQGRLDEAGLACRRGLAASRLAGSPPIEARLLVRLADIEKLQGNFAGANEHYAEARRVIAGWDPASDTERQFADYWDARIKRELGNLFLFMALPREGQPLLLESHDYFQSQGNKYEQAHACHSLGWAAHVLGDWDASLEWRRRGMALGRELDQERGWQDRPSALHDSLYMGLVLVDHGDLRGAEESLLRSLGPLEGEQQAGDYHEAGLAHLALSRVYRADWERHNLQLAQTHAELGLDFYARMPVKDPVRMAIAHNTHGELMMDLGRLPEARLDFEEARQWSLSSIPPNRYYEAKARLRRAAVNLAEEVERQRPDRDFQLSMVLEGQTRASETVERGLSPATGQTSTTLLSVAAEDLNAAELICQEHGYQQLMAQAKLLGARLASLEGDSEGCVEVCWQGMEAALLANRFVLQETWASVEQLAVGQPDVLAEIGRRLLTAIEDPARVLDASIVETGRLLCSTPTAPAGQPELR